MTDESRKHFEAAVLSGALFPVTNIRRNWREVRAGDYENMLRITSYNVCYTKLLREITLSRHSSITFIYGDYPKRATDFIYWMWWQCDYTGLRQKCRQQL